MSPDFQYFLELAPRGRFGHSPLGLLVFCLPAGLGAWAIFRRVVRPAGLLLLPPGLRPALTPRRSGLSSVVLAILLGAASHSAWDSFTHADGWSVRQLPALATTIHFPAFGDVPLYKVLQHGSTILGIAAVSLWVRLRVLRQPSSARVYSGESRRRAARVLALLLAAGAAGAFLNGLRGIDRGAAVGLGYAAIGAMAAFAVALVVFGLIVRWEVTEKIRRP